jgi:GT2 family glycosyltransferase
MSVRKAAFNILTEVIVVDNNSQDETVTMLQQKFPDVRLIANTQNTGFAKANNQGIEAANGRYLLFLNPDTVVREDTFDKIIGFAEKQANMGGLGVKMIDGTGHFLPESKRGFPSPAVAFYKTFGLARLFPKSKIFNQYHLGYLDKDKTQEVDVLSGAFMLVPQKVLEQTGYWDEDFFMYGEDIDLSYRIKKAGYTNFYFAETTIIHYKGESTKKGTLNYVKTFYEAMIIFAKKHFEGSQASLFILMLKFAIYFRAALSLFSSFTKRIFLFLIDAVLMYAGMLFIKDSWEIIRFDDPYYYDNNPTLVYFNFPFYVGMWVLAIFLRGGYDKNARSKHVVSGILVGTLCITSIYAFFPISLRSSRMLILLSMIWAFIITYFTRSIISLLRNNTISWSKTRQRNIIIAGHKTESSRVLGLLYQAHLSFNYIGTINPGNTSDLSQQLGQLCDLESIVNAYKATEIIFCEKDIRFEQIIYWMTRLGAELNYKIVPSESKYIIGSNSKNATGELYAIDISFNIINSIKRRNKRIIDIGFSFLILILSPFLLFFVKHKYGLFFNIIKVFVGKRTWVGYSLSASNNNLPPLQPAILTAIDPLKIKPTQTETIHRINLFYAKDYEGSTDIDIILKAWRELGRQVLPNYQQQYNNPDSSK